MVRVSPLPAKTSSSMTEARMLSGPCPLMAARIHSAGLAVFDNWISSRSPEKKSFPSREAPMDRSDAGSGNRPANSPRPFPRRRGRLSDASRVRLLRSGDARMQWAGLRSFRFQRSAPCRRPGEYLCLVDPYDERLVWVFPGEKAGVILGLRDPDPG